MSDGGGSTDAYHNFTNLQTHKYNAYFHLPHFAASPDTPCVHKSNDAAVDELILIKFRTAKPNYNFLTI
jgi:hypothetical protein